MTEQLSTQHIVVPWFVQQFIFNLKKLQIFLISVSTSVLLVYKTTIYFWMFTFYPVTFLNWLSSRKFFLCVYYLKSLVAQTVTRLSTMRETRVRSLGREDPWRRKWQSTPVLLPGKSHGQKSLVGYSPWGCKESDTTERLHLIFEMA